MPFLKEQMSRRSALKLGLGVAASATDYRRLRVVAVQRLGARVEVLARLRST